MRESWRECAAAMLRLYTSVLEAVDASVDDGYMRVCGDGGKVSLTSSQATSGRIKLAR